ncbi:hypothetical protein RCH10_003892 [Variovorax sp. GrIS 2.14]|jgi:hypothetical protein|uniref:hypothetical protein n=1 Tax=unclassified Variovorax TaxID=663243 RepID=UPI0019C6DB95|nr:hypothetical protein [Variovorax sp. RTB1]MBC7395529.1 hypothetical protein [Variovorax sp.]MEB0112713.1 hypothetical protein [Variovorax sp. RTB1]
MPMNLLRRLRCSLLPIDLHAQSDIEKCIVLRMSHLIDADLPPLRHGAGHTIYSGHATVMQITALGLAALMRDEVAVASTAAPTTIPPAVGPSPIVAGP